MVGILIVSHSEAAALGIAQIASGMSGSGGVCVPIAGVGGNEDGGLGVSVSKVADALVDMLPRCDGVLVIPDLGSSILSSRGAIGMLSPEEAAKVVIADAPVLEGSMMAAVEASVGSDIAAVAKTASEARYLKKSEH